MFLWALGLGHAAPTMLFFGSPEVAEAYGATSRATNLELPDGAGASSVRGDVVHAACLDGIDPGEEYLRALGLERGLGPDRY